ncbi:MAG: energy transducer TonB [Ignavibacteriae bacterium]|nr:energy transducer TonB [Ignavibacteriota bacterium]
MIRKNPEVDLRFKYRKTFELALIIALAVMIIAFKFFPDIKPPKAILSSTQEVVDVEDIEITKQENRPPPPPRPPIPIEAPGDQQLEDVDIMSSEIDITADAPPPPPKDNSDEETYFVAVEDLPEPAGGIQAIQSRVVYPEMAKRAGVEGMVFVQAFVDENGVVTKTDVIKGIGAGCDEAAEKAVKETKFKPGKQRGKPVKVKMSIPIRFRLTK